ncbi:MAG: Uma2 family endonuclease [Chloroflexota bacterium]|nr:Uma2 family endonuclease [Chloroflexota bacterium]
MATTKLTTIADLERLAPEGDRWELIRGELRRVATAGGRHGEIAFEFGRRIGNHVVEGRLGRLYSSDTGFVLARDPDVVLMPDVAFVQADRLPGAAEREGIMPLAPDLVVEVVSPTERAADIEEKVSLYLAGGVSLIWVAEPRRRAVTVHCPGVSALVVGEGEAFDGGDLLPGFRLPVEEVFR